MEKLRGLAAAWRFIMNVERWVLRFAGTVVLASLLLAHFVNTNWLWLTAFVGANLLQSSFTGFCPLAIILRRLGLKSGQAFP
jgi:Inner membrane protein YgaP-like, transmembrane domain